MRRVWPLLALLAAGCAQVEKQPEVVEKPVPETSATAPTIKSDKLKYLANRKITPQPTRPLNVRSRCSHRDAIGTTTKLDLMVKEAQVKKFSAQVNIRQYGACRFSLEDFEQVEQLPQVLLRHKADSGCTARMWEQGPKVTIAFNGCAKSCEKDAFSYLWPIMVEAKSGRCF